MPFETSFEFASSAPRFGSGCTQAERLAYTLFGGVRVEPSMESVESATEVARKTPYDAVLAMGGGGSTLDTARMANLYPCWPADFLDYVNAPISRGKPVPDPVKPLVAIPTTAGTGSETTGTAMGTVDRDNTRSMPSAVAASCGLDVLCHAIESFTAIPYTSCQQPECPSLRPACQGANPISDLWSLEALHLTTMYIRRAVADGQARPAQLLRPAHFHDAPSLVQSTLPQQRITLSPRPAGAEDLAQLFEETMNIW